MQTHIIIALAAAAATTLALAGCVGVIIDDRDLGLEAVDAGCTPSPEEAPCPSPNQAIHCLEVRPGPCGGCFVHQRTDGPCAPDAGSP